jgi:predicted O-methyltransferase YrrM
LRCLQLLSVIVGSRSEAEAPFCASSSQGWQPCAHTLDLMQRSSIVYEIPNSTFVATIRGAVPQPPDCSDRGHERVLALARLLSTDLASTASKTGYSVHGMFGIFADGGPINRNDDGSPKGRLKPSYLNYNHTKTLLMYRRVCTRLREAEAAHPAIHPTSDEDLQHEKRPLICEVGFNAGLSAMLLLEAAPHARVVSFDIDAFGWTRTAARLMHRAYAGRWSVMWGDSHRTVPEFKEKHQKLRCDVAFVDGLKDVRGKYRHIADLRKHLMDAGGLMFVDDVLFGSLPCVRKPASDAGELRCKPRKSEFAEEAVRKEGLAMAANASLVDITECRWPAGFQRTTNRDGWAYNTDGFCVAEILAK